MKTVQAVQHSAISSTSGTKIRAFWLARLAQQALIAEAELTPKPGLVDRRGQGAHSDLSLVLMRQSARTIEPYLVAMALLAASTPVGQSLREELAKIGRQAERAMYLATGGCNTHKGAIWVMGLFVAAASIAPNCSNAADLATLCARISSFEDRAAPRLVSHGHIVARRYGFAGAHGEAQQGFPHVVEIGLPALRAHRFFGETETAARLNTLLRIMSRLNDTCVIYRGQTEGLQLVRNESRRILAAGGYASATGRQQLRLLDASLLARRISPGGSADLLAATLFLDAIERGQDNIEQDTSFMEDSHGTY